MGLSPRGLASVPKAAHLCRMKKSDIETFFQRLSAADPEPRTELQYSNPYTLLVAVVLSAQATDKGVNKATEKLFKIADSPQTEIGSAAGREKVSQNV